MAGVLIIGLDHQAAAMARLDDPATARIPGKNQVSSLQIRIKTTSPAAQGNLSSASELGQKSPVQPLEGPSMFGVASGRPAATTRPSPCSRTLCSGVYRKVHDQPGSLRLVLPRPQNPAVRCRGSRNVSKPSQRPAPPTPHTTHVRRAILTPTTPQEETPGGRYPLPARACGGLGPDQTGPAPQGGRRWADPEGAAGRGRAGAPGQDMTYLYACFASELIIRPADTGVGRAEAMQIPHHLPESRHGDTIAAE